MQNKITARAYFLFLLLLPFAYSYKIVDPALVSRQIFVSAFLLLLAGIAIYKNATIDFFTVKNPLYLAIAGYFVFAGCAFFGNPFTAESHAILSKQLLLFVFLILTTALLYGKRITDKNLIQPVIGFAVIMTVVALYQLSSAPKADMFLLVVEKFSGLSGNKNLLSSIVFLGIPFLLMGLQLSKKVRIVSIIALCLSVLVILFTQTRAVYLACLLLTLILIFFFVKQRYEIRNRSLMIFGGILLIAGIAVYKLFLEKIIFGLRPSSENMTQQYLFRIFSSRTFQSRTQYWENSLAMFKEHPFGIGAGNWQVDFPKYGLEKFNDAFVNGTMTLQRPHNDFLQVLCENGIFGLAAYCAIFGVIIYQLISLIRTAENKSEQWKFIYLFGGITGYIFIAFFDFPFERIEHQVLLLLLFAMVVSAYSEKKNVAKTDKPKMFLYVIVVVAFYALFVASFRFKGEYETIKMRLAKNNEQWDEMLFFANKAENHFYKIDPSSMPINWYKGIAYFNRKELGESIVHFEKAYAMAPYQIQVIDHLATAYLANKEKDKAVQYYFKALAISPKFEEAKLNLAGIYYNEKQYEKAYAYIEQVSVGNKSKKYHLYLAVILQQKINRILTKNGDVELSKRIASKITKSSQIFDLYFAAKAKNVSFEDYVLEYGRNLKSLSDS